MRRLNNKILVKKIFYGHFFRKESIENLLFCFAMSERTIFFAKKYKKLLKSIKKWYKIENKWEKVSRSGYMWGTKWWILVSKNNQRENPIFTVREW